MEKFICQSCSMPMDSDEFFGTEANGEKTSEYCSYCYENGEYTTDVTMEEMADICVPYVVKDLELTEAEARKMMMEELPKLKRWKNK